MRWVCPSEVLEQTGFTQTERCPPGSCLPPAFACLQASQNYVNFHPFCIVNTDAKCAWQGPKEKHQQFCVLNTNTQTHTKPSSLPVFLSTYDQDMGSRYSKNPTWMKTSFSSILVSIVGFHKRAECRWWLNCFITPFDLLVHCRSMEFMQSLGVFFSHYLTCNMFKYAWAAVRLPELSLFLFLNWRNIYNIV